MSSSRDYYKSSQSSRDALPPIRDVLGDQFDLPPHRDGAYSFDAVNRALPDTSSSSRSRGSSWRQSAGPTLPPIHHSRTQGGYPSAAAPTSYNASRSHSHPHPQSSHGHPSQHQSQSQSQQSQVPYSFDVFRPSSSGLVHASSSSRSQGILRSTRADAGRRQGHSSHGYDGDDGDDDEGSKRYVCGSCGKRFGRPSSLKTHEVVHSDEKPFECPHPGCGKTFTVASNMRRHFRKTHESSSSSSMAGRGGASDDEEDYGGRYGGGYASGYGEASSSSATRGYYTSSRR